MFLRYAVLFPPPPIPKNNKHTDETQQRFQSIQTSSIVYKSMQVTKASPLVAGTGIVCYTIISIILILHNTSYQTCFPAPCNRLQSMVDKYSVMI